MNTDNAKRAKKRRARFGDIIEVSTPKGLAYLQYASRHPSYGDTIRVLPGIFSEPPAKLEELVKQPGYFTFYPLALAVSRDLVKVVAKLPIPEGCDKPAQLRCAGAMSAEGRVLTWIIKGPQGDYVRHELHDAEKQLPIVEIWNHEMLTHQLAANWHPTTES